MTGRQPLLVVDLCKGPQHSVVSRLGRATLVVAFGKAELELVLVLVLVQREDPLLHVVYLEQLVPRRLRQALLRHDVCLLRS